MERIRTATPDDAAAVAAIYAPYVRDTVISFEDIPPSAAEMRDRITRTLIAFPFLVCETEDGVVAYANASAHRDRAAYRWSCDVTVYVESGAHRRGLGRKLYTQLFEILARQRIHSAYAGVALPNDKSVGLHEAMGFQPLGVFKEVGFKQGAWRDVAWWRRDIGMGLPAGEPIPFPALG